MKFELTMSENWIEEYRLPIVIGAAVGVTSLAIYIISKHRRVVEDTVDGGPVSIPQTHVKARGPAYPRDLSVTKFKVSSKNVCWKTSYPEYSPVDYTAPSVIAQPVWADLDIRLEKQTITWNAVDGDIDRTSHMGKYQIVQGLPRNPVGRTGMCGRGLLGKWGPNHAADPIVTRWKRNARGEIERHPVTHKPILQFVAVMRRDSGEWAIPGGMVEAGESVSVVLKKEFAEEAMNVLESSDTQQQLIKQVVDDFFTQGRPVYRGYVDDPRNTDNAWMETVAVNFHDETGKGVGKFHLHAGDDACKVQWTDIDGALKLYASHFDFINQVARLHHCHW